MTSNRTTETKKYTSTEVNQAFGERITSILEEQKIEKQNYPPTKSASHKISLEYLADQANCSVSPIKRAVKGGGAKGDIAYKIACALNVSLGSLLPEIEYDDTSLTNNVILLTYTNALNNSIYAIPNKFLAESICLMRKINKFTQEALANAANLPLDSIKTIESGYGAELSYIFDIAYVFKIPIDSLFPVQDKEKKAMIDKVCEEAKCNFRCLSPFL